MDVMLSVNENLQTQLSIKADLQTIHINNNMIIDIIIYKCMIIEFINNNHRHNGI